MAPSAVVICTKDRPYDIARSLTAAAGTAAGLWLVVVDASDNDDTWLACRAAVAEHDPDRMIYRGAAQAGLTRQRNEAIAICRDLSCHVVHFIDDDTEVLAGYFEAIDQRFKLEPELMGVGGVIVNQPKTPHLFPRRLFLLASRRPSSVLSSGRNMMGQYLWSNAQDRVDWLSGCSMSFRMTAFAEGAFDASREGYCIGEDVEFGFRLSRRHALAVEPSARCIHHCSSLVRDSARDQARERTLMAYRLVKEHRHVGLSLSAFWWSVVGDVLLRTGYGIVRRNARCLSEALGVVAAVGAIAGITLRPQGRGIPR